ncbi:tubulin-tyrosine ligase family-domain-containing protein [Gamsiella multidivaricata]|uniref:tubulin-tyrosine ligase family-domain-containing protein n=1 Tax=Gamsiella multidivaricata TaxID=101098 RepID=UPI00221E74A4|nr:tubulin-tyrosine ligase family-domain-containing protein [Gamsiella multidivaricata]KAI7818719.1 tubulin-tyrosine ligase family-domain-containing protein [Gamsiella multidivaricata]
MEYKQFLQIHQYQLASIPENLWEPLFQKLGQDLFDAGEYLELHYGDPLDKYSLHVKKEGGLKKHGDIFLVDHAWTTKPETSRAQLLDNPQLVERLTSMMDISVEDEEEPEEETAGGDQGGETYNKHPDLEVDQAMVELVASQGNVTEARAKTALQNEKGDVIAALMSLTLHPDHDAKGLKNLEEAIGGQVKQDKEAKSAERKKQETVNKIMSEMWKFVQTYEYAVVDPSGQTKKESAWYIMDEVGSSMAHSDTPNCVCSPFIYVGRGTVSYSIIYPIEDIPKGGALTRDFVPADIKDPLTRKAYLQIFNGEEDAAELIAVYESDKQEDNQVIPFDQPFTTTLTRAQSQKTDRKLRLYTTTEWVATNCKLPQVELVDTEEQADLLWFSQDFKEFDKLTKGQKINQLENESCMTFKHNLAALVKAAYGTVPWSSTTYNLTTELAPFVGHYLWNQEHHHRNLWICKPWNMARGLQITVQEELAPLVRLRDTGPKIVQEYIQTPVLYEGRKFDLRYIVLLKATHKVEGDPSQGYEFQLMVYKMFWIRLANQPFELDDFDNYEKHFTVMNYGNYNLTQLLYTKFIENFEKEHASKKWVDIQADINEAIKAIFAAAVVKSQPLGLGAQDKTHPYEAFSIYGIDVMLKDDCQPVVVEVNFSPDCTRACKYDPEFLNNILTVVEPRAGDVDKALGAFNVL